MQTKNQKVEAYLKRYKKLYRQGPEMPEDLRATAKEMGIVFCTCCGCRPKYYGFYFLCWYCWKYADCGFDADEVAGGRCMKVVEDH